MTKVKDLHDKWKKDPDYEEAYDALEAEFAVARAVINARSNAGLTQSQLAERLCTSQSAIARIESGKGNPTTAMLKKVADATNTPLQISFVPTGAITSKPARSKPVTS